MAKKNADGATEGNGADQAPVLRSAVVYRVLSKRGQLIIPNDDEQLARMVKGEIIPRDQLVVLRVEPGQTTDRVPLASELVLQTSGWIAVAGSDADPYREPAEGEVGVTPQTPLEELEAGFADEAARLAPRIQAEQDLRRRLSRDDAVGRRMAEREATILADRVARAEELLAAAAAKTEARRVASMVGEDK